MEREEAERRELQRMIMDGKQDKMKKDIKPEEDPMASVPLLWACIVGYCLYCGFSQYYLRMDPLKMLCIAFTVRIEEPIANVNYGLHCSLVLWCGASPTAGAAAPYQEERGEGEDKRKKKEAQLLKSKMKCGACGQTGHMRTNKECPKFSLGGGRVTEAPVKVAMTDEEVTAHGDTLQDHGLVDVVGTKLKLSKSLLEQYVLIVLRSGDHGWLG
ncbi:hypothetical protein DPMN_108370 [Dreissena polymorpha]|uniref:Zinc knuckle domain-containing protein n=1 Tax=Dreissena polymorpha TaxID=45954 RepID=A0A9D4K8Y9_DREPO|nr:hypothetical protein DPMN_108370 [Dreissena polymorpha]